MKTNGYCPECGCEVNTPATRLCDACAELRRQRQAARLSQGANVGRQSSPEAFELREIPGMIAGSCYRGIPSLRSDVKWYRGKHGN